MVAYVEPEFGAIPDFRGALVEVAEDALVVPPDAGGEHGELAEPGGVAQAEIERDQSAKRGTAQAGRFTIGADAVLRGDPGQDFAGEGHAVLRGLASAHAPVAFMGVFGETAVAGIVDADDNEGLDFAGFNGGVGVFADFPGAAGEERGARVEEVLAILQVEDGVGAFGLLVVAGGEIDDQVALVRQVMAGKGAMKAQTGMERWFAGGQEGFGRVGPGVVVRLMVFQMQGV